MGTRLGQPPPHAVLGADSRFKRILLLTCPLPQPTYWVHHLHLDSSASKVSSLTPLGAPFRPPGLSSPWSLSWPRKSPF